jgi:hypothetical protein
LAACVVQFPQIGLRASVRHTSVVTTTASRCKFLQAGATVAVAAGTLTGELARASAVRVTGSDVLCIGLDRPRDHRFCDPAKFNCSSGESRIRASTSSW